MYALHHSVVFRTVPGFRAVSLCSQINSRLSVVSSGLASSDEVLFFARFFMFFSMYFYYLPRIMAANNSTEIDTQYFIW